MIRFRWRCSSPARKDQQAERAIRGLSGVLVEHSSNELGVYAELDPATGNWIVVSVVSHASPATRKRNLAGDVVFSNGKSMVVDVSARSEVFYGL